MIKNAICFLLLFLMCFESIWAKSPKQARQQSNEAFKWQVFLAKRSRNIEEFIKKLFPVDFKARRELLLIARKEGIKKIPQFSMVKNNLKIKTSKQTLLISAISSKKGWYKINSKKIKVDGKKPLYPQYKRLKKLLNRKSVVERVFKEEVFYQLFPLVDAEEGDGGFLGTMTSMISDMSWENARTWVLSKTPLSLRCKKARNRFNRKYGTKYGGKYAAPLGGGDYKYDIETIECRENGRVLSIKDSDDHWVTFDRRDKTVTVGRNLRTYHLTERKVKTWYGENEVKEYSIKSNDQFPRRERKYSLDYESIFNPDVDVDDQCSCEELKASFVEKKQEEQIGKSKEGQR